MFIFLGGPKKDRTGVHSNLIHWAAGLVRVSVRFISHLLLDRRKSGLGFE